MYDLLIKNANIVDGSGGKVYRSDLVVQAGRIALISPEIDEAASVIIDCPETAVVAPGFIDTHSHGDFSLFKDSDQLSKLAQGVTTDIVGNCGITAVPVNPETFGLLKDYVAEVAMPPEWIEFDSYAKYLGAAESLKLGVNVAFNVGHGTIRVAAMGMDDREPTQEEMDTMLRLMREAMESGAVGLSSGLIYPPGVFAKKKELVELCKVVKAYDGVYATHMRNESFNIIEGLQEAIEIARESGVKMLISHHKVVGRENYGKSVQTLEMIRQAQEEGLDIRLDQYPYTACSTSMSATIPPEFHDGGTKKLVERLKDPVTREQAKERILGTDDSWDNMVREAGFENILVISGEETPDALGKSLKEYADLVGKSPMDALFDILIENDGASQCVEFGMDEEDIERIMRFPWTMVGSDSILVKEGSMCHPRSVGTFPRVLGTYVRDRGVLSLEEAVKRMTKLPAEFFGLDGKGQIAEGYDADLVIFDPQAIGDQLDYLKPFRPNTGILKVIVNGQVAAENSLQTDERAGKIIRRIGQEASC